jgi:hypothetical protein
MINATWLTGEDKLTRVKEQGQTQFDKIKEMVTRLEKTREGESTTENYHAFSAAERAIQGNPVSVLVRSDWREPGAADNEPNEYQIWLSSCGPAVRIIGDLDEYSEPHTARLEAQDWFQPWTEFRPLVGEDNYDSEPILLSYARCFSFE